MEEESWAGPLILFTVLMLLGAAFLFGRDWVAKREKQGLPAVPPEISAGLERAITIGALLVLAWVLLAIVSAVFSARR